MSNAPGVTGKSGELVYPVTYAFRAPSRAIALISSWPLPPRKVAYTSGSIVRGPVAPLSLQEKPTVLGPRRTNAHASGRPPRNASGAESRTSPRAVDATRSPEAVRARLVTPS